MSLLPLAACIEGTVPGSQRHAPEILSKMHKRSYRHTVGLEAYQRSADAIIASSAKGRASSHEESGSLSETTLLAFSRVTGSRVLLS